MNNLCYDLLTASISVLHLESITSFYQNIFYIFLEKSVTSQESTCILLFKGTSGPDLHLFLVLIDNR